MLYYLISIGVFMPSLRYGHADGRKHASLGAPGPAACSPMNLLPSTVPDTAGSASARAASLSSEEKSDWILTM